MDGLIGDLRFSARALWKNRAFAAVAVMTLALGIGANTAVYSLTDQVLLRRLPVERPDELVVLRMPGPKSGSLRNDIDAGAQAFSYPFYKDLRDSASVFSGLLARFSIPLSVAAQGRTERAAGELVSGNYFDVLGTRPALGRLLTPEDDKTAGGRPVAVLAYGYWTRRFGGDPAILDQSLAINGRSLTVVGVTSETFRGVQLGASPDVFIPIGLKAPMTPGWDGLDDRSDYWLNLIGRLAPGVTREGAEAALQSAVRPLLEQDLAKLDGMSAGKRERFLAKKILLAPGAQGRLVLQGETRGSLLLLSSLVGLVLLIACANVANLLIARGAARRREIALRLALGARRFHLVRQLLAESVLLSLLGGCAGLLVAAWSIDSILALFPPDSGIASLTSRIDGRVLAFNFGAALVTGLAFGLIPALRATRPDLVSAIKEQGAGGGTGTGHVRLRKGLVVAQITVTMVVLTSAGLFALSLRRLQRVDLGMRADHLLTFSVEPQLNGYSVAQASALFDRVRLDLASLPGVAGASAAELAVLTDTNSSSNITLEGYKAADDDGIKPYRNWVGPGYFATMGIPLLTGREIMESDTATTPRVALINETMARRYFAGRDPVGTRFAQGAGTGVKFDFTIVGVVGDSKHSGVKQGERDFVYLSYAQDPSLGAATFYLRSALPAATLVPAVRALMRRHDPNLPVYDMKTLLEQRDESLHGERILTSLSVAFALLAALLAAIGLYGMMAYSVLRRTAEIGIRMALGATPRNVRALVLREAMTLAAAGLLIGLPFALAAGRLARSLLFGVQPGDPRLVIAAGLFLIGVMLLAAYIPARRATRIDPLIALRSE